MFQILTGRLGADAELYDHKIGNAVVGKGLWFRFGVDNGGPRGEESSTTWYTVFLYGAHIRAEARLEHYKSGRVVEVVGSLSNPVLASKMVEGSKTLIKNKSGDFIIELRINAFDARLIGGDSSGGGGGSANVDIAAIMGRIAVLEQAVSARDGVIDMLKATVSMAAPKLESKLAAFAAPPVPAWEAPKRATQQSAPPKAADPKPAADAPKQEPGEKAEKEMAKVGADQKPGEEQKAPDDEPF